MLDQHPLAPTSEGPTETHHPETSHASAYVWKRVDSNSHKDRLPPPSPGWERRRMTPSHGGRRVLVSLFRTRSW